MNKHLEKVFSVIMIFALVFGSFFVIKPVTADAAGTDGVISISNVRISNPTPSVGEAVDITFNLNTDLKITYASFSLTYGHLGPVGNSAPVDPYSKTCSFSILIESKGEYRLNDMQFQDADGNVYSMHDSRYTHEYIPADSTPVDLSAFDFTVGSGPVDNEPPVIDISSMKVLKKSYEVGDTAIIQMKVTDNDGIWRLDCEYNQGTGGNTGATALTPVGNNIWQFEIPVNYSGDYSFDMIQATDNSNNKMTVYNTGMGDYGFSGTNKWADLSKLSFKATGGKENDKEGPYIDTSSIYVSRKNIGLKRSTTIYINMKDESKIVRNSITIKQGKGGITSGAGFIYNSDTGKYECTITGDYYGTWELIDIYAEDSNGNVTSIYNTAYSEDSSLSDDYKNGAKKADLSAANFYVGISDPDTGVFITGNGMSLDVKLNAKHLAKKGDAYNKLFKKGYNVDQFMELKVSGNYSEGGHKVKVDFPVNASNGSKVLIKHLRPNGQIQEEAKTVYGGKVSMYVSDFSPFMILSTDNGQLLAGDEDKLNDTKEDKDAAKKDKDSDKSDKKDDKKDKDAGVLDNLFNKDDNKSSGPNIGLVVGIAVLLIAAGGGGAYYYYKKKK